MPRTIDLQWPAGGLVKRFSYQRQHPFSTPSAQNVRSDCTTDNRERGGQRPGIEKAFSNQITGASAEIRLIADVRYKQSGVLRTALVVSAGTELWWEASDGTLSELSTLLSLVDNYMTAVDFEGQLLIADYDTSGPPADATDGVIASTNLLTSSSSGNFADAGINANDYVVVITEGGSGSTTTGTFQINTVATTTITLVGSHTNGTGVDFYVTRAPKVFDPQGPSLAIYTATSGEVPSTCKTILSNWYRVILTESHVDPNEWWVSKQGDKGNWDLSATGPARAINGQNSRAGQLAEAVSGAVAHSDDCVVFFSRNGTYAMRGDPAYGGSLDRMSGEVGCVFRGAMCHTPLDQLYFLSADGIYMMAGGCGGKPISISREYIPEDLLDTDVSSVIPSMAYDIHSRGIILAVTNTAVSAATHYWIDTKTTAAGFQYGAFWPEVYATAHEAFYLWARRAKSDTKSILMIGCRDGYVRRHNDAAENDDSTSISSFVFLGPFALGRPAGLTEGKLDEIVVAPASGSGDLDLDIHVGGTEEQAFDSTKVETVEFNTAGFYPRWRGRHRGVAACLKLYNGENSSWELEGIQVSVMQAGRRKDLY